MDLGSIDMVSVFLQQEQVGSEAEAMRMLRDAKKGAGCVGGKVIPPSRQNKNKWTVLTCYEATEDKPPTGMARLSIPRVKARLAEYGIRH